MEERIIAGIDIGSYKIASVVGRVSQEGVEVLGYGVVRSSGLKGGTITNIWEASRAISEALYKAEEVAGIEAESVVIGISGVHLQGHNFRAMISITGKEVTEMDIRRAIETAVDPQTLYDQKVIHILPQQFVIDSQKGIKNPVGMVGKKLEVFVHVISIRSTVLENFQRSVANLNVDGFVVNTLAAGEVVLSDIDKESGVLLIDIGASSTDIAVYYDDSVWYTTSMNVGGMSITNDIAQVLKVYPAVAEDIKIQYGVAKKEEVSPDDIIRIKDPASGREKEISRYLLAEVIEARLEEIFSIIRTKVLENEDIIGKVSAGAVLVGGTAQLPKIEELAEEVLGIPVRIGIPKVYSTFDVLNKPIFSPVIGLLVFKQKNMNILLGKKKKQKDGGILKKILGTLDKWIFGE